MRSTFSRAAVYLSSIKLGAAVGIAACSIACLIPMLLALFGVSTFVLVCNVHEAVAITLVVGSIATAIVLVVRKRNARRDACCGDPDGCHAPVQLSVRKPERPLESMMEPQRSRSPRT